MRDENIRIHIISCIPCNCLLSVLQLELQWPSLDWQHIDSMPPERALLVEVFTCLETVIVPELSLTFGCPLGGEF